MNLLVAFKGSGNSANRLVSALQDEKLFLTNSFAGLQEDIARMDGSFDVVYMFGLDKTLRGSIRVEACACLDEELVFSALDYTKLALAFQVQGLSASVGTKPQLSLCNAAYWHMLQKYHRRVVFCHVPSIKYITDAFIQAVARAIDTM